MVVSGLDWGHELPRWSPRQMIAMLFGVGNTKKHGFKHWTILYRPCVPTGLMFGRIGNFIGGELIWPSGDQSDDPFGMIFPTDPLGLVRHPSQIYQALCEGLSSCLSCCGGLAESPVHVWQFQLYS